jgi:FMN phosphatase YigB (HAD superfamily)
MKAILFIDFDGTICHDRFWRSLPVEQYTKIQEYLFGGDLAYANEWMRGERTSEEVNELLAEQTGIPYEKLWNIFVKDCETMRVSPSILERIQSLRDTYIVILITGNTDSFTRFTVPALKLQTYFDLISNSYDEKISKTDNNGEVFKKYATKYRIPIESCFIIDDSQGVCATFELLGGTALLISEGKDVTYYLDKLS